MMHARILSMLIFAVVEYSSAQLPPLIDRELFFGDPEISGAQISPDGNYITFLKPFNNVRNIWVKGRNEAFEKARPLTADTTRPVTAYFWSRDSRYVLYVQDKLGDENYRVYAVDPKASGTPVPPSRDLTPVEKVRAEIIDVPRSTPREILVGLNDRNPQVFDVYRVNLETGTRTLIRKNDENVAGWMTDLNGELRLGIRQTGDGGTEILNIEGDTLVPVYTVTPEESAGPERFTPDGHSFYLVTNKGNARDKTQLELFDLKTGKSKLVEKDPLNEVDFGGALFSELTNELLATYYTGDMERIYPKQKKFRQDYTQLKELVPPGRASITGMTRDENLWMVSVYRDVDPGSVYLFDRKAAKVELLYKSRPTLPTEDLALMKPVHYTARDGMSIPAYLTLPKGISPKKLPTVLDVHGGPWARDYWGYDPVAQFLANRGYAVLQINFRGSTGYGKKFLNAGNKQWGTGTMQNDLTDGVRYLIKKGIADPKRVAISGGSYGGYATLAGLAFTPDLYAAGFSIVGPSNIITLLNSIPPYWTPMQKIFAVRVGDKDDPKERTMLERQSPLNSAKNIQAPLYVVQGANDPRVKKAESEQIVVALRDLGRQVEYMLAPDEGHGFLGKVNRLAMYTAMEKFLARHLGGRVQKDVSPEIQKKLDAITVDVKTVTLTKPISSESVSDVMPAFASNLLREDTLTYSVTMQVRGRKVNMTVKRTLRKGTRDGKAVWSVIEESMGGMGSGTDTVDLDASTLLPIRRSATQGQAGMNVTFKPDAVSGKMMMGSQEMPINAKVGSPVLSDGAGLEIPVSTLPLAKGYDATVYQFDMMSAKAQPMVVSVEGTEKISVGAGTFQAYRVEVSPKEGDSGGVTLWVAVGNRRIVRTEANLPPQAGGGTVVSELEH